MLKRINYGCLILIVTGASLLPAARSAHAQSLPVLAYYPAAPTVAYVPEARGLFGLRTVYRPVAAYPFAPMTTYYAPSAATAVYYPSANVANYYRSAPASYYPPATTMYYRSAPATYYPPVTTMYYPSANVTSDYRSTPASYYPPATTTYYPPANVTSYYAPAAPFVAGPPPVSVRYAPRPMIPYTVIVP